MSIKPEATRLLTEISRLLAARDIRAYIVGGFVRDTLLGRDTADIDIAVDADALAVARDIAGVLDGKFVLLDDINMTGRLVLPGKELLVDFTTLKGDIEHDLAQRDFTINALAYGLNESIRAGINIKDIIDPFEGQKDLERRLVTALNSGIFKADAARLIRAVRIAAELGFNIEGATEMLITKNSPLITGVAEERIREELLRLLALPGAGKRFFHMDRLGLLTALIPELAPAKGVDQPFAHVFDVFEHSLQTISAVEFVLREGELEYAGEDIRAMIPWSERLERHFNREVSSGSTDRTMLKLAALLHDIAKPQTKTLDEGRARFLGHQAEGAAVSGAIMERLRFSKREIELTELLITHHLRPTQMGHEGLPTDRAVYRFFRDLGEAGIDVLFLSLADHLAARGPSLDHEEYGGHARMTAYVLEKHFEEIKLSAPPKIIDGRDVMEALGLPAGPIIGEMLEALKEAQAAGEITDKAGALKYLKHLFEEKIKNIRN